MPHQPQVIRVALAGNPNSGKTSVFNMLTGLRQQVGNWPGVTVERKVGQVEHAGYRFEIVDLPGTYSLTSYTIEERVARQYILEDRPDVIINVVDAANLAGHLFLTTQLLEMGVDLVVDLNMWDEFERSRAQLDTERFAELLGAPTVTSIGHRGVGKEPLLDAVVRLVEARSAGHRHVPVTFGAAVEDVLVDLSRQLREVAADRLTIPPRYLATKLLEGDPHIVEMLHNRLPSARQLLLDVERHREHVQQSTGSEAARVMAEGRYGFIDGLLRETQTTPPADRMQLSRDVDRVLTHRLIGLPLFLGFMWLLFNTTFTLGAFPMAWIERLAGLVGDLARQVLPAGAGADLVADGIIGGVGSVAVFLPNIMILFFGISLLEDTGYMARVAFVMDRVMHLFGLHGKSFIPMLMGFGCSVPAIMATRTLESRRDRILTTLLIPHMSCSARLPVYVLLAGAFFGAQAGNVVLLIYLTGILVALLLGIIFSRTIFRGHSAAFVMELPPYRWPTTRGLLTHTWERSWLYMKKIGGVILVASAILWFLGAYPQNPQAEVLAAELKDLRAGGAAPELISRKVNELSLAEIEYTVVGRIGRFIAPVIQPLGFDWRMGISLVTGFVAKEVVVSTMGVLYQVGGEQDEASLPLRAALTDPRRGFPSRYARDARLVERKGPLSAGERRIILRQQRLVAVAFLVFVLLYIPCVATVSTIRRELGPRWMTFDIIYQVALAWLAALLVYQGGRFLGLG